MKKFVDVKSGNRGGQKFFVLQCQLALTGALTDYTFKTSNAQRHLLRLLQIIHAQYRHEQAMLQSECHLLPIIGSRRRANTTRAFCKDLYEEQDYVTICIEKNCLA